MLIIIGVVYLPSLWDLKYHDNGIGIFDKKSYLSSMKPVCTPSTLTTSKTLRMPSGRIMLTSASYAKDVLEFFAMVQSYKTLLQLQKGHPTFSSSNQCGISRFFSIFAVG